MFHKLFSPDSGLMIAMTQVTDCIFLSLFFLLGCFPVVTMGASAAALYDSAFHAFRRGSKHSWQRFFRVFRDNLKPGILPSLVYAVLFFAGAWGLIQVWNAAVYGSVSWAVFSAAALFAVVLLGILSVLFPLLSRFENSFAALMKNTLLLSLVNLPRTLALGIVNGVSLFLCARFLYPLFFLPALSALIGSLFLEPMFKPYMKEDPSSGEPD